VLVYDNNARVNSSKVSVVIPVYNGGSNVEKVLDSVFKQQGIDLEVIVIDDFSTDGTTDILKRLAEKYPFRLIVHQSNQGLAATLNDGMKNSQGEFLLTLHQDCELVEDDWLKKGVDLFQHQNNLGVITGKSLWDSTNFNFAQKTFMIINRHRYNESRSEVEDIAFSEDKCDLYNKKLLLEIGGFPDDKFRVSGEDQYVCELVRRKGQRVVVASELHFRQWYGNSIKDIPSLLRKGYTFGMTMPRLLMHLGSSLTTVYLKSDRYARGRTLNRMWSLLNSICILLLATTPFLFPRFIYLFGLLGLEIILRAIYYFSQSKASGLVDSAADYLKIIGLGFAFDVFFFIGFVYGFLFTLIGKRV
jgi:glycosyltransferase involved in cell wall biosynthesis